MSAIESCFWSLNSLPEALEVLARRTGYAVSTPTAAMPELTRHSDEALQLWVHTAATRIGAEAEPVAVPYPEVSSFIRRAGPALLRIPGKEDKYLVLLKHSWFGVVLVKPDLTTAKVNAEVLVWILTQELEQPLGGQIDQLLVAADVAEQRRSNARQIILQEQLGSTQLEGCWILRLPPSSNFWQQLHYAHVPRHMLALLCAHAIRQGLFILGWWLIVTGALQGEFDQVWLLAWGLILLTSIPFDLAVVWLQSLLTINMGRLFKQRLLFGSLQLHPEEVRHQGIGQFLGRVLESETLETMVLGGGFAALIAVVELGSAIVVLGLGAGGLLHALSLVVWLVITLLLGWRYYYRSQVWRSSHRHLINSLIERMVGHRTRLAQEDPHRWHEDEDQALAGYMQLSQNMDNTFIQLTAFINRGWLVIGLAGLAYVLLRDNTDTTAIAVSLGGIMLASQAFNRLIGGMHSVIGVLNAWKQVGPLFHAATRGRGEQSLAQNLITPAAADKETQQQVLLYGRDLVFRYRDYGQPILRGCDLVVNAGDRLLLEGGSGGGKSTLAALLTGLRSPTSGLLLLHGLDRQTFGAAAWRQRVVAAPQFHENHVMTETFAFNLLMGRNWPPQPQDLEEAETICRELGLGALLERMPAGLQQMVGESGWQLSHGERSRLFIARALLQRADFIVLDESFAALDPENLRLALRCVLQRAPTLMVIAHP